MIERLVKVQEAMQKDHMRILVVGVEPEHFTQFKEGLAEDKENLKNLIGLHIKPYYPETEKANSVAGNLAAVVQTALKGLKEQGLGLATANGLALADTAIDKAVYKVFGVDHNKYLAELAMQNKLREAEAQHEEQPQDTGAEKEA